MSNKCAVNVLLALVCVFLLSAAVLFAQICDMDNPPCPGDFNCDCDVDGMDAARFKVDFGRSKFKNPCPPCPDDDECPGDFDCDLDVDGLDAARFKVDFGRSSFNTPCPPCGQVSTTTVPPSTTTTVPPTTTTTTAP